MDELAAFIAARYDEEDYWANVDGGNPRMQRDLAIKRAILAVHQPDRHDPESCATCYQEETGWSVKVPAEWPCKTARLLVSEFSDHPGYKETWKP